MQSRSRLYKADVIKEINNSTKAKTHDIMRILFVTNMFPESNQSFGVFVKEQIEDIVKTIQCEHDLYFINARDKGKLQYIISLFAIPLKLARRKYDIVHIHYGLSALFLFVYNPKAKVFLTLHGSDILQKQGRWFQVYVTKNILKRVDKVFVVNKQMETIVKSLRVNYEIIPCGVNVDFFNTLHVAKKDENAKLVIFPGNPLVQIKNYPLFESVINYLKRNSQFVIHQRCVNDLSREGVRDLLREGDCLLMTSVSEGSPQVIKEALSCGLPVVSVPVGDVPTMIERIPHCFISETFKSEELASLVLKSFLGKGNEVRLAFTSKNIYDHRSITHRIIKNYGIDDLK